MSNHEKGIPRRCIGLSHLRKNSPLFSSPKWKCFFLPTQRDVLSRTERNGADVQRVTESGEISEWEWEGVWVSSRFCYENNGGSWGSSNTRSECWQLHNASRPQTLTHLPQHDSKQAEPDIAVCCLSVCHCVVVHVMYFFFFRGGGGRGGYLSNCKSCLICSRNFLALQLLINLEIDANVRWRDQRFYRSQANTQIHQRNTLLITKQSKQTKQPSNQPTNQ